MNHTWIECDAETHVGHGALKMVFEFAPFGVVQALQLHDNLRDSYIHVRTVCC